MPWRFKAEGSGRSGNRPVVARRATSDAARGVMIGAVVQRTGAMSQHARAADDEVDVELADGGRGRDLGRWVVGSELEARLNVAMRGARQAAKSKQACSSNLGVCLASCKVKS